MFSLTDSRSFLEALVAPKLRHLEHRRCSRPSYPMFSPPAKFNSVQHLTFSSRRSPTEFLREEIVTVICTACPAVRHLEIDTKLIRI